ncbi:aspartyl protease family protein [Marchantia polymorpha subsp. ruderalis]|uniref:Peptidase A1 domain-containing protein n=2 Tax=Marchantia polymorpha TaxID=3197 RepID=A0AAF6AXK0_MARPO|nr:hypothetical protein MARPO_0022s0024 [Marchantia polymorpha]BBN04484.1 hypothetical protein Mp_3g05040 [Marchantia polymorpha subsp. ruderalis]|eukprot:PTQ43916.1 hypothetical protein MARPO_0022s0024 [Marchantia polymorpha]
MVGMGLLLLQAVALLLLSTPSAFALASSTPRGIRAELVHRDHESRLAQQLPHGQRAERDAKSSRLRAEELGARGQLRQSGASARRALAQQLRARVDTAPGEYVMSLAVGTPAQHFVGVIDTGSDLTWLQCAPCQACFEQANSPFLPQNSSTYSALPCTATQCQTFRREYNDEWVTSCNPTSSDDLRRVGCRYSYFYADFSNTTGDFVTDTLTLQTLDGNETRVADFAFGCSRRSFSPTSLFEGSDGLVGLAQGGISFPAQVGAVYGDVFSYCLVDSDRARSQSSTMYFGAEAATFNVSGLQYTPLISNPDNPTFYYVGLEGIAVDGAPLALNLDWFAINRSRGGVFLDSGTTLTIVEPRALQVLVRAVTERMNYSRVDPSPFEGLDYCWNVRGEYMADLRGPSIVFNFTGVAYELAFENAYLLVADRGYRLLCLAMAPASEDGAFTIIGNIQQRNFHVVYDRAQNRIGFAKKDCSLSSGSRSRSFPALAFILLHFLVLAFIQGTG